MSVGLNLQSLVAAELSEPADPHAVAMARALAELYPQAARAVLFYGSCLREKNLDGLMLDFYLIVSDYRAAYDKRWLATANRLVPPNVFPFAHGGLAAKYAVLSEADFYRLCGPEASNVSVWARFAQPSRLLWVADGAARDLVVQAVALAAPTLLRLSLPMILSGERRDTLDLWRTGFGLTYNAELRAERSGRSLSIVDVDPARYEAFGRAALADIAQRQGAGPGGEVPLSLSPKAAARRWARLQHRGKWLTVVRLAKASLTFAGGIDYLAWKINRHAGTKIEIKPWQRQWPLVAALLLVPKLLRQGAVK